MAAPATLDPSQCIVIFNGQQLQGFAPGTFVKPSRDEDAVSKTTGADGEVVRVRNRNRGGSVTVTLLQSSASNDVLSAMANLDENGLPGGVGALLVKDNTGRALYSAEAAWVKKQPDGEHAKEATTREWVIDCAVLAMFVGGNN
jgi:hypothetical protein